MEYANLMQSSSIPVEVRSPKENRILSVPRKGLALYALQYTETDMKGEYTFTVMKTEEYKVIGPGSRDSTQFIPFAGRKIQQSTLIVVPHAFPWKLTVPIFIIIVTGGLLVAVQLRRWPPWKAEGGRRKAEGKKIEEMEKEEIVETVENVLSMPNEILFWKEHYAVEQISLTLGDVKTAEGTIPCHLECAKDSEIILNDTPTPAEGIMLSDGDVVRYDKFAFKMELKKDTPPNIQVYYLEDLMLRASRGKKVRWSVEPVNPQPPVAGTIIPLNFIQGDILYIGRDAGIDFAAPNGIALRYKDVASRQLSIRRNQSLEYFLKALDGETILNGNLLEHGNETKLNDGDIIKIGANRKTQSSVSEANTFSVILTDKKQPQLLKSD